MFRHSCWFAALLTIAATAALAIASSPASGTPTPPNGATSPFMQPTEVSPSCGRDARRRAACGVVQSFFRDVNSRSFASACALLGRKLRSETYGMTCEHFIASGAPDAMPWGILGARVTGHGVVISVSLGQSELDHIRMRRHRAFVGVEKGRLLILGTQLVA